MKPKALIIRTAGTNCDKETEFAFQAAGVKTCLHHINYIKEKPDFSDYQILCIPGGFSYGDDLGAGKILSLEFICWFKESLQRFVDRGGLILGICNGFQVLTKTGILPDADFRQKVTLTDNDSGRFEDRWVYLKVESQSVWLKDMDERICLPVAHGEGKFYAEKDILDRIEGNHQVVLRYTDKDLNLAGYPFNPNGSLNNIAGITDSTGRVLGLMPHPERFIFKHHCPFYKYKEVFPFGVKFFSNAADYFK
ncbi:MAG: phosphoribosylformylglycinamidine synthase I [Candidatus Omnitrophica bacterium]|nr:phosphoribosylformylglycinamidine synthase I [Candidatus Omnitrophota bacterium]MDD5429826.1 phosphoribosylformylglycinamidine synthase I [Candidatus Omnitrophota bacterium]